MSKVPLHHERLASLTLTAQPDDLAETLVKMANNGDEFAKTWVEKLIAKRTSPAVLNLVNDAIMDVDISVQVALDASRRQFGWRPQISPGPKNVKSMNNAIALLIARLVNAGYVDRLRHCQLSDCGRYFVGDPRSKWCSDTCGSKFRQRKFRKGRR